MRRAADEILLEQRRRDAQHAGDVVEPVALVVGRQQIGDVDLQVEQIADGVAVLRAIETMDRLVARMDLPDRAAIQRLLERDGERFERRLVGTRHALRRHHPAAQLHDDLLPHVGVRGGVGGIHAFEREAAGLGTSGMAGQAVLLNERRIRQGGL